MKTTNINQQLELTNFSLISCRSESISAAPDVKDCLASEKMILTIFKSTLSTETVKIKI